MKSFKQIKKSINGAELPSEPHATPFKASRNPSLEIEEIKRLHNELTDAARTTRAKAIRLGELLTQVKKDLGHGNWLPFVHSALPFSERTAQHYMGLFERREHLKSAKFADLLLSEAYKQAFDESSHKGDAGVSNAARENPETDLREVAVIPAKKQAKKRVSAPPKFNGADLVGRVKSSRKFFEGFRNFDLAGLADEIKNQLAGEIALLIETWKQLAAQLNTSAPVTGGVAADLGNTHGEKEVEG